jgi:hypothetical protein
MQPLLVADRGAAVALALESSNDGTIGHIKED